jgi:hypothetical protein
MICSSMLIDVNSELLIHVMDGIVFKETDLEKLDWTQNSPLHTLALTHTTLSSWELNALQIKLDWEYFP